MIDPIDRKYNLANLKYVSTKISHLEHFLFFGSLLGFFRHGNLLQKDDDVDIYIDINHREELYEILAESEFHIRINTLYFIQGTRLIDGVRTYVDFYLYENDPKKEYIVERWNIEGNVANSATWIHVPKDIIFPTKIGKIEEFTVGIPNKVESCCEFIYGDYYKTPLKKKVKYAHKVFNNKPLVFVLG